MRKIPRPFKFPFGKGQITAEVSIKRPHLEPTVQLLEFDSGQKVLRSCYYHGNRFINSQMEVSIKDCKRLLVKVHNSKKLNDFLSGSS